MKKRCFIVIILAGIIFALTNSMWLWKPIDVMFNVNGNLETKIDVSLGNTQSESQKTDLSKNNQLVFKIPQKSYFETLKIAIQIDSSAKSNSVIQLSDFNLKHYNNKIDDLGKFDITGASHKIINGELVLFPTSEKIVLEYPVRGQPMVAFEWFLLFLIFSIIVFNFDNVRNYFVSAKQFAKNNKKIVLSSCVLAIIFACLTPHWWVNSEYWRNKFPLPIYHGFTAEFENVNKLAPEFKNDYGFSYCVEDENVFIGLYKPFRHVESTNNWNVNFNIDADANLRISQNFKPSRLIIDGVDETDKIVGNLLPIKKGKINNVSLTGKYLLDDVPLKNSINYVAFALSLLLYFAIFIISGKFFEKNNFLDCVKENKIPTILFLLFFGFYFVSNHYSIYHTNYFFDYDVFVMADSNLLVQNVLHSTQTRFHSYFFIMFYPIFDILFLFTKNVTLILRLIYCLISAVTVVFTYKSIKSIISQSKILPILLTLVFGFAFSPLVMTYAFDVYPISAMYLSLLIYFTIKELNNTEENLKNIIIIAIICALSFGVSTINLITNLVILNSIFLKKRKSKDLLFVLLIFAVATCFFFALQKIPCSEVFSMIFSNNFGEEFEHWFQNISLDIFFNQSLIMPLISQGNITMIIFWSLFVVLIALGFVYMENNKFKSLYLSCLGALVLNFVFGAFWAPQEGFLFALNHLELWFVALAFNISIIFSAFKSKSKLINILFAVLFGIFLLVEIPQNCVANREIQLDAMKKIPLTYPIIEENHRE